MKVGRPPKKERQSSKGTECAIGSKARRDRAIGVSIWQDVTCGEQEEEAGQI